MKQWSVIDRYAAIMLMISFFLPMQAQAGVVMALCLYFFIASLRSGQRVVRVHYRWALVLGALSILYIIAVPFSLPRFRDGAGQLCGNRMSFLLMPFIFATITADRLRIIKAQLIWFVYSCFVVLLAANIAFLAKYGCAPGGFHGVNHVTYRIFFERFTGLHPTYLSMYLAFSLCILMQHGHRINRVAKYLLFYSLLVFLISLLAKSPLIAIALIFLHYAWVNREAMPRYKWFVAGGVVVVIAAYLSVPFISQRINEMTGLRQTEHVTDNSINVRKMILSVDKDMLGHYWVTGAGPGRMMHLLKEQYLFKSLTAGYNTDNYDPHSEYFYDWLSLGLIGLIALLVALATHFTTAIRQKQYLYVYLLFICFITFFTESVLSRQQGIIFFSLFTSLFFFHRKERSSFR